MKGAENGNRNPVPVTEFLRKARHTQQGISYLNDGRIVDLTADSRRLRGEQNISLAVFRPRNEFPHGIQVLDGYSVEVGKALFHKPEITARRMTIMTRGTKPGVNLLSTLKEIDTAGFDFGNLLEPLTAVSHKSSVDQPPYTFPETLINIGNFIRDTVSALAQLQYEQQPETLPPFFIDGKPVETYRMIYHSAENQDMIEIERYSNGLELDRITMHVADKPPHVFEMNYSEGKLKIAKIEKTAGVDAELENYETVVPSLDDRIYLAYMLETLGAAILPQSEVNTNNSLPDS